MTNQNKTIAALYIEGMLSGLSYEARSVESAITRTKQGFDKSLDADGLPTDNTARYAEEIAALKGKRAKVADWVSYLTDGGKEQHSDEAKIEYARDHYRAGRDRVVEGVARGWNLDRWFVLGAYEMNEIKEAERDGYDLVIRTIVGPEIPTSIASTQKIYREQTEKASRARSAESKETWAATVAQTKATLDRLVQQHKDAQAMAARMFTTTLGGRIV